MVVSSVGSIKIKIKMTPPYLPILGKVKIFEIDAWLKLREKDKKLILVQGIEPLSMGWEFRELTTTSKVLACGNLNE